MFSLFFSSVAFVLIIGQDSVLGTVIQFSNCGPADVIQSVSLSPCPSQPCTFEKGVNVTVGVNFTTAKTVSSIHANVYGLVAGVPVPYPLPKADGCHQCNLDCPLQTGQYSYINIFPVLQSYPDIKLPVKWELVDQDKKAFLCFVFPMEIKG